MPPKEELERMKDNALEMSSYYYKGFGNTFHGIIANAELSLTEPDRKDLSENAYAWLNEIEQFYEKIPFEKLHGREEFYPLFVVKRLLPKFKETMDRVFVEKDKDALLDLQTDSWTIVNVGRLYWDSFQMALKYIRSDPEAKNFRVKITDYKGKDFHF